MDIFLSALADAGLDLLKILPFLLAVHLLIEVIEHSASSQKRICKLLNGGYAPAAAGALGIIPQCGFSVVATKLFAKKNIRLGTLIAVYIATSDEALPILIATPNAWGKILPLMLLKLVYAVAAGYLLNFLFRSQQTTALTEAEEPMLPTHCCCGHAHTNEKDPQEDYAKHAQTGTCVQDHPNGKQVGFYKRYLKHPLMHTLTIAVFILLVNLAFNLLFEWVGEDRILAFLETHKYFQPFIAGLVGLIPNCGASVVLTQSYAIGGLNLGGAFAGLSVSAGIAFAVLLKENKNIRQNLTIIGGLYAVSCLLGFGITLLGF